MSKCTPDGYELALRSHNKRKLNRLKNRRNKRKLKILFARFRVLVRLASYIFLIWAFMKVATLPYWYIDKGIFAIYPSKHLELEGYSIVTAEQIMEKLYDITLPEKPLYLVDTGPIEKRLLEIAPVKKVFVRRYWLPARLRIIVDERTPVISIAPSPKADAYAVFTRDGNEVKILESEYLPLPEYLPTYKVITYDDYKKWKPAQIPYVERLAFYLESATGDKLVYLDIRNPDDVYAQMENVRLRIGALKGKEVTERIEKVSSVIPEAMKIKDNINYIDLRWNNVSIKLKKKEH